MLIAPIIILLLFFLAPPIRINKPGGVDYLSKESTLPIKGLCVFLVFCSHFTSYVYLNDNFLDKSFLWIIQTIGQLMVVMFFFYSGYGIYNSYFNKEGYMKMFLLKRFLPVWLSFAICICFFLIENALFGINYNAIDIVLSFTGWTSVGNSNWFMFVTFAMYLAFYICFRFVSKEKNIICLVLFSVLCVGLLVVLYYLKPPYWCNTLLCFPVGMWYARFKTKIDALVLKNNISYFTTLGLLVLLFAGGYFLQRWHGIFFVFYSVAFALLIITITMRIRFRSYPLTFLGEHVFSIYILQRLVFRFGEHFELLGSPYVFFACAFAITILISFAYDWLFSKARLYICSLKRNVVSS